jgi:hypothetical protein
MFIFSLQQAILSELGLGENAEDDVLKVTVPRTRAKKPSQQDLEALAREIEGKIMQHLENSTVKVDAFFWFCVYCFFVSLFLLLSK